jgi:hypothetical protein
MIDKFYDILEILKASQEEKDQFIKLIHREDNLTDLLYWLTDAGYSPGINFEAGRITALNKRFFSDRDPTADQVSHRRGRCCGRRSNLQQQEPSNDNSKQQAFLKSHLSHYTKEDIDIVDIYRTKPVCGKLCASLDNTVPANKLIEIDVSKAYTAAFCEITEILIFNEFDNFRP